MSDADIDIKQNDLRPDVEPVYLEKNSSAVDLSNATEIEFHLNDRPRKEGNILSKPASIVDAKNGEVKYEWEEGDTDLDRGKYYWEFEIHWDDGDPETFPTDGFRTLMVHEEGD